MPAFELVREHGLAALGPILIAAGLFQVIAGTLRLGGWFRAISPAVVHGMLAGIGALIVIGQFHVLFDAKPLSHGLDNLAAMPERLFGIDPGNPAAAELALLVGVVTIAAMLGWEKFRPASMKLVPGALVAVLAGTLVTMLFELPIAHVVVPESIWGAVTPPEASALLRLADWNVLGSALAIAFIASAETLLSAAAVDRMHDGPRTDYNKELRAQGIGNLLCGFAGALPMTGVIVRSSANVQAGAASRLSTILHGAWILAFVALLPWLLREIPMAALAGILVVTGWRLVSLHHVQHLFKTYGALPALIWAATFVTVVATDLLTGVVVGIGLSLLEVVPHFRRLRLKVDAHHADTGSEIALRGAATFVGLPKLLAKLETTPADRPVRLDLRRMDAIDHSTAEMLADWLKRRRDRGQAVEVDHACVKVARLVA